MSFLMLLFTPDYAQYLIDTLDYKPSRMLFFHLFPAVVNCRPQFDPVELLWIYGSVFALLLIKHLMVCDCAKDTLSTVSGCAACYPLDWSELNRVTMFTAH